MIEFEIFAEHVVELFVTFKPYVQIAVYVFKAIRFMYRLLKKEKGAEPARIKGTRFLGEK